MLKTCFGSEDGFSVRRFLKNYHYETADSLAVYFVGLSLAKSLNNLEKIMSFCRNRRLERITAPASEPVTLAETKLYLRVDSSDEDALITDLIVTARMNAEQWLKSSLISQTWKLVYDDYINESVAIEMTPIINIVSVIVINRDLSSQTISSDSYYLNAARTMLTFDTRIDGFLIEITYNAGYGNSSQVPSPIKYGILAHIAAMYDERGLIGQANLPSQVSALYSPFRELLL